MPKVKIPKRVAGVKIPKKVRKRARQTLRMAEGDSMRDLASAAIGAARAVRRASKGVRIEIDGEVLSASKQVRVDADRLGDTIRNAALDGLRSFLEGLQEGLRERGVTIDVEVRDTPANDSDDGDADGDEKKPTRRSPGAGAAPA